MAEKLLPSPSVLESGVDTMILDMAPMLPDIEITEQDLNLFALSNTLQANIAMPENQEHLQTTIAQARAQLQTRMDAMHNSSPAGKQSADSQTYPELVVPEVEAAQNVFEFDGECQDDYLSERNETFETMKLDFESKKKPSLEEQILFQKAQNNELQRLNRLKSQREKREELSLNLLENHNPQVDISFASGPSLNHEQYELFCSENENGGVNQSFLATERQTKSRPKSKGKQANSGSNIASKDKRQNAALGFDAFRQSNGNKRSNGKRVRKPDSAGGKKGGKWKSKSSKQKQKRQRVNLNFDSLFSSNIINAAKANVKKQELPKSSAKAKDKALKELIANIPHADPKVVSTDKSAIMAAIVKFSKRPKADGNGSWLHPDMKTSLFHYQLLGVGFMRDRENSAVAPFGGFLCDEMGFGKTIQAIANMVDGQPSPSETVKTTLIVVPPHLISHWLSQLKEHCKPNVLGAVVAHHAGERIPDAIFVHCLHQIGVIVTTYSEVRKSYPELGLSSNVVKESEMQTIWRNLFYEKCGVLHRVNFHRIILDEAHEIKNHLSRTSMAVRMLSGRFRWVISGTPIHNNVQEFFPYFEFLKIPQTGNFQRFCRNYCPDGETNYPRLSSLLRGYMLRRTHEETLFGLPILKLPDIDENTVVIHFSNVEKFLYREIIKFVMQQYMSEDDDGVYSCHTYKGSWTLLLRLRMFTSHLLLAQEMLRDILTDEVMKALSQSVGDSAQPADLEILLLLKKLQAKKPLPHLDDVMEANTLKSRLDSACHEEIMGKFRSLINSSSSNIDLRKCVKCKSLPYIAYIASCMHVYCHACFAGVSRDANGMMCFCNTLLQKFTVSSAVPDFLESENENAVAGPENIVRIEESSNNWIFTAGHLMPSAKLTAIQSCVAAWLNNAPDTKVTIFTQFLGMVNILGSMCSKEGWGYTTLTGRVPPSERHKDIEEFRTDPTIRVLISSLRAGGTGLDLTMADKCILVDLWWNEAIEQQAFCRLFRIGQKKDVEIVRITVKNSIDDRIQLIQNKKTTSIDKTMGPDALSARDTLDNILEIFGVVEDEGAEGGFVFLSDDES